MQLMASALWQWQWFCLKKSEPLMNFSSYYNMVLTRPLMQHRLDVLRILD